MKRRKFLDLCALYQGKAFRILGPKNDAYGGEEDALRNFRLSTQIGMTMAQGCLVRMSDKLARAAKLIQREDAVIYDETIEDTLLDLSNYCNILMCILVEEGIVDDPQPDEESIAKANSMVVTHPKDKPFGIGDARITGFEYNTDGHGRITFEGVPEVQDDETFTISSASTLYDVGEEDEDAPFVAKRPDKPAEYEGVDEYVDATTPQWAHEPEIAPEQMLTRDQLSKAQRVVEAVQALGHGVVYVNITEVGNYLGHDKTTARKWVGFAIKAKMVVNDAKPNGSPSKLRLPRDGEGMAYPEVSTPKPQEFTNLDVAKVEAQARVQRIMDRYHYTFDELAEADDEERDVEASAVLKVSDEISEDVKAKSLMDDVRKRYFDEATFEDRLTMDKVDTFIAENEQPKPRVETLDEAMAKNDLSRKLAEGKIPPIKLSHKPKASGLRLFGDKGTFADSEGVFTEEDALKARFTRARFVGNEHHTRTAAPLPSDPDFVAGVEGDF